MRPKSSNGNYYGRAIACIVALLFFITSCQKNIDRVSASSEIAGVAKDPKALKDFEQVNLVANNDEYGAAHINPHLLNAWGIAFSGNGAVAWVNAQADHTSHLYNQEGVQNSGRPFVNIPLPAAPTGGNPTGIVFANIANQFTIPPGPNTTSTTPAAATFIFVGVDGVLSAWNGTYTTNAFRVFAHPGSAYTGLAIGNNGGNNFIYLANFATGQIEVYNKDWTSVPMSFTDPDLPAGYAPFNIQNVGGSLYVMYAKVDPEEHEEEAGPGLGYVDIYTTGGTLVKRFVSRGQLNAPWGVAMAPAGFWGEGTDMQNVILVGNFGDGHINAFNSDGAFLGQLRQHGEPIVIEGLWAIMFPPGTTNTNRLYFAAGPDDEQDGLFGYIKK
jgi:uncharacterized protein (TIGR03118 family)